MTISELQQLRESEDRIEFKEAKNNFNFEGGKHTDSRERRKCVLGYIVALANEGGGLLVFGMKDKTPHEVVGTDFAQGKVGAMEYEIYKRLHIRVRVAEHLEAGKRVLVFEIPSRPKGKPLYFEDTPLMRVGESLTRMSEEVLLSILQEQESDFSKKICAGLSISDLDTNAIDEMKRAYAQKQNNPLFLTLSNEQVLSDLKLLSNGKLNYAALILLGKEDIIHDKLPQSGIVWEFRNQEEQIHHDTRTEIIGPLFSSIDKLWNLINQPNLNKKHPIQSGAYIFDIFNFNEGVMRESILNAIAHRDYTLTSEVVVKQFPEMVQINSPGGFPIGVTLSNLLTVSSTPRNRLITEILEKTGLVERSGQGVDKIFSITLSEGKDNPDYSRSDNYQVSLRLNSIIKDKSFHVFISHYQNSDKTPKLGVEQIIALSKVRDGKYLDVLMDMLEHLEKIGLVQKIASSTKYALSKEYFDLSNKDLKIGERYVQQEVEQILLLIQGNQIKIGALELKLSGKLNRNQIKYILDKLLEDKVIKVEGQGKGTKYSIETEFEGFNGDDLTGKVVAFLKEKYKEDSSE